MTGIKENTRIRDHSLIKKGKRIYIYMYRAWDLHLYAFIKFPVWFFRKWENANGVFEVFCVAERLEAQIARGIELRAR